MSPVLRDYGVAYFPMGKALKLQPGLEELATTVKAGSKSEAARIGDSMLLAHAPEHVLDYFKAKVWKDRPGLPRSAFDRFITDFFQTVAVWNKKKGEPDPKVVEPSTEDEDEDEDEGEEEEVNSLQDDARPQMCNREIERAHAINDVLSGLTNDLTLEEAKKDLANARHTVSSIFPLLMSDIDETEYHLSPDLEEGEIHMIVSCVLAEWSENYHVRLRVAMDAIVEYRRPSPQPVAPILPSSSLRSPRFYEEPSVSEEFRQQLLCSVLQGLCANPAYSKSSEGIAVIAIEIVDEVIRQQEEAHE